jgi:hypothetical protein
MSMDITGNGKYISIPLRSNSKKMIELPSLYGAISVYNSKAEKLQPSIEEFWINAEVDVNHDTQTITVRKGGLYKLGWD